MTDFSWDFYYSTYCSTMFVLYVCPIVCTCAQTQTQTQTRRRRHRRADAEADADTYTDTDADTNTELGDTRAESGEPNESVDPHPTRVSTSNETLPV